MQSRITESDELEVPPPQVWAPPSGRDEWNRCSTVPFLRRDTVHPLGKCMYMYAPRGICACVDGCVFSCVHVDYANICTGKGVGVHAHTDQWLSIEPMQLKIDKQKGGLRFRLSFRRVKCPIKVSRNICHSTPPPLPTQPPTYLAATTSTRMPCGRGITYQRPARSGGMSVSHSGCMSCWA